MAKLKAAILQCDDVLEKFQEEFGNYPSMIIEAFHDIQPDIEFHVFDVRLGGYPELPSNFDFFVITGSKASVYDEDSWIVELVEYVKLLRRQSIYCFGICFGHQIMALACGCDVQKAAQGWGVGIAATTVSPAGREFGFADTLNMIVSHQDQVLDIPPEALLLSYSDFCPFFAVKWSKSLFSIQGHPEWKKEYSKALMNDRRDRIPGQMIEEGINSLSLVLDNPGFIKLVLNDLLLGS